MAEDGSGDERTGPNLYRRDVPTLRTRTPYVTGSGFAEAERDGLQEYEGDDIH